MRWCDKGDRYAALVAAVLMGAVGCTSRVEPRSVEAAKATPVEEAMTHPGSTPQKPSESGSPPLQSALSGGSAAPGQADRPLPATFQSFEAPGSNGRVLVGQRRNVRSARQLLLASFEDLAGYFDHRPRALAVIGSADDQQMQATFDGLRGGQPILGLAVVDLSGTNGVIGMLYDSPDRLPGSERPLANLLKQHLPAAAREPAWRQVSLPDGSGTMVLPEGWVITSANKGMVDASGPEGYADLGLWCPIITPQLAAYRRQQFGLPSIGVLVAPYSNPVQAIRDVAPPFFAGQGIQWRWLRLIEQEPVAWPGGQGAFIHFEAAVGKGNQSERFQSLTLILMNPNTDGTWTYYSSGVSAPSAIFGRSLPVLLKVWANWKVDDRVFQERLQKAAQDMKDCARMIQEANAYRQHVMDRAADDWDEYLRGTHIVRDAQTGELTEESAYGLDGVLQKLNQQEGYERWKIIPLKDINSP